MAATDDSMSDSVQFFEGVEKLLEIWFTSSDNNSKCADLRKIPRFVTEYYPFKRFQLRYLSLAVFFQ